MYKLVLFEKSLTRD